MSLQEQAAQSLELALVQLKLGTDSAKTPRGVEVSVTGRPEVTVLFRLDQRGALLTEIASENGNILRVDYEPTTLMAMELAQMVNDLLRDHP